MVHCQVPPSVFFYLSIIRYGAIHQSSFFLTSVGSIGDFFFTLFHTSERQGWQMMIMCNIARRICYTWLIKTTTDRASDQNNNHASVWLENSQRYCFPWGTQGYYLAWCQHFVHFQIIHPHAVPCLKSVLCDNHIKETSEMRCLLAIITLIKHFWYNARTERNKKWEVQTNKISPLSALWCAN